MDFTTNTWGLPETSANKAVDAASFTNGTYTITLAATSDAGYYFNTDGYLMLGKKGATLTLPAFNFEVGQIVITGRTDASGNTLQNIYVGETTVSTQTKGAKIANVYDIAEGSQAAGTVYVLKVESAHNTQITKIEVYKKGTTAVVKKDAGLKFAETSFTVETGKAFTAPTLTKATTAEVTYTSSKKEVATVDAATGAVTIVGVGTTTITASADENDDYFAGKASYTITVKNPSTLASYTLAKTVESGKAYLIVASNEGALKCAQLDTRNYGYLQVADVTATNDVIETDQANEIIIETVEGGYTLKQTDGRYYYQKGTYDSFNFDAEPTEGKVWTIVANADGTFKITNTSVNKFIQFDPQYKSYGSYSDARGIMPNLYVKSGASSIDGITVNKAEKMVIYNLAGQRVTTPKKGLYIINGKKVVIK